MFPLRLSFPRFEDAAFPSFSETPNHLVPSISPHALKENVLAQTALRKEIVADTDLPQIPNKEEQPAATGVLSTALAMVKTVIDDANKYTVHGRHSSEHLQTKVVLAASDVDASYALSYTSCKRNGTFITFTEVDQTGHETNHTLFSPSEKHRGTSLPEVPTAALDEPTAQRILDILQTQDFAVHQTNLYDDLIN